MHYASGSATLRGHPCVPWSTRTLCQGLAEAGRVKYCTGSLGTALIWFTTLP